MSITAESMVRVGVVVTFLRMDAPPTGTSAKLPAFAAVKQLQPCGVEQYRLLYNTVGADYLWWLRRALPDSQLASLLADPRVAIHVLYVDEQPAGFYELDSTPWPTVNLSYFGLMPGAIGHGLGTAFLRHAVDTAWQLGRALGGPRCLTVNTCTADHPRALPGYQRAGFRFVRQVHEEWRVPTRLGLTIPDALRLDRT